MRCSAAQCLPQAIRTAESEKGHGPQLRDLPGHADRRVLLSLAYGSVAVTKAPPSLVKGVGKYPIPVMILARLAVDIHEKGHGLGKALLKNAMLRTLQAAEIAGLKAIFVQAKDAGAEQFYSKHGFIASPDDPLHLFFPLDSLQ